MGWLSQGVPQLYIAVYSVFLVGWLSQGVLQLYIALYYVFLDIHFKYILWFNPKLVFIDQATNLIQARHINI